MRNPGREIDVAFTAELAGRQSGAVSAMLAHDDGVLVAPPGSGKTVMACAVIAERSTSTLDLVDRKALAEQWRSRIEQFLGIRPGQVSGGRRKLGGVVDVGMLPSLARRDDIAELTSGYGQVIVDECHHVGAAAYEHSVKRIGAQFWLGLTATPTRRDGLGEIVTWQLGPLRHTVEQEDQGLLATAWETERPGRCGSCPTNCAPSAPCWPSTRIAPGGPASAVPPSLDPARVVHSCPNSGLHVGKSWASAECAAG